MIILLINSPIRLDAKPSCIPYGLATVANTLRGNGFDVESYDISNQRQFLDKILETLKIMI